MTPTRRTRNRIGLGYAAGLATGVALLLAGCAGVPDKTVAPCPVCAACNVCVAPPPIPTEPRDDFSLPANLSAAPEKAPVAGNARGSLVRASWLSLPDWGRDDAAPALAAFLQSCTVLALRSEWRDVCADGARIDRDPAAATAFFQNRFDPFQILNADGSDSGTITGYYEPLLRGSRVKTGVYKYPLYAAPADLITVDLAEVYPDLKNRRLRGRIVGNKLVPYPDRSDIERGEPALRGLEIAWIDDPVEVFFLHIQGSGQVQFPNGSRIRVGYADQNGHPFRSVASLLIRRGELRAERTSLEGMKAWARQHPAKAAAYLNANPSYVFFKQLPDELSGPIGTLGVPLTAERSLAVDAKVVPLGVPVYLATSFPGSGQELRRLMVAQDTGGAIFGAVRADFFWGFGDDAGTTAGRMKQSGRMWVLLPKGYDPNAVSAAKR